MKNSHPQVWLTTARMGRQRGVVLFFALVCLVAIMLAAVALVRSVDTNTIIAGNLALQQSATRSADAGTQKAIEMLDTKWNATTMKVLLDSNHPFNQNDVANGYYASLDPNLSLTTSGGLNWNSGSKTLPVDGSGNVTQYIVQRMCRTAGVAEKDAGCLFSSEVDAGMPSNIPLPPDICTGGGCPPPGQSVQFRITSKTTGPKNSVSYVQTFVY
jgi:Tfp pilus assembly protein PilX